MDFPELQAAIQKRWGPEARLYNNGRQVWVSNLPDGRKPIAAATFAALAADKELDLDSVPNTPMVQRQRFVDTRSIARALKVSPAAVHNWIANPHNKWKPFPIHRDPETKRPLARAFLLAEVQAWYQEFVAADPVHRGRALRRRRGFLEKRMEENGTEPIINAGRAVRGNPGRVARGTAQLHVDIDASVMKLLRQERDQFGDVPWAPSLGQLVSHRIKLGYQK